MHLLAGYEPQFALAFTCLLTLAMVLVLWLDATRYVIPNSLNLAILVAYAFAAYILHLHWIHALMAATPVLLVGLGLFALGLMGGGDVKLLAILTLWTGWGKASADFLLLTAVVGGLLVLVVMTLRFFARTMYTSDKPLPRLLTRKQPVPYGIAIAGAFLLMLHMGVPGLVRLIG